MTTRRVALIGLMLLVTQGAAFAAELSAQDFVAGIYATYKGKDAKGVSLDSRAKIARYFTPSLTKLIDNDSKAAAKRGEVGELDGDPFIDAQDYQIDAVAIDATENGNKAVATVKFKNFDKDTIIVMELVKLKQGWRIDEMQLPNRKSLRALFKKK
jgi:hypothetical protein